jgi:hypothetical protein
MISGFADKSIFNICRLAIMNRLILKEARDLCHVLHPSNVFAAEFNLSFIFILWPDKTVAAPLVGGFAKPKKGHQGLRYSRNYFLYHLLGSRFYANRVASTTYFFFIPENPIT